MAGTSDDVVMLVPMPMPSIGASARAKAASESSSSPPRREDRHLTKAAPIENVAHALCERDEIAAVETNAAN